ncbi:MAG: PH domain-containing protein [Saccharofermentanales bacterium]
MDNQKHSISGPDDSENSGSPLNEQTYCKLDPRILTSWRISRWIRFGILAAIQGAVMFLFMKQDFPAEITIPVLAINAVIFAYLIITPFLYPAIEYRQWRYAISEDRVDIRHGIFFIQRTIIPIVRIQHVTITQGPINRKLGVSTILINTASGVFKIEGLADENAEMIAESLKSRLVSRMNHAGSTRVV